MAGAVALVMAAGRGERFGTDTPKQYATLAGRPLLQHCLSALASHPGISAVRAVIRMNDWIYYDKAATGLNLLDPIHGGASRQESVRQGLESLVPLTPERVLIHDGARPLISRDVVDRVLAGLERAPGAVAALPVNDTLKHGETDKITGTLSRAGLWRAQTPQGFHFPAILAAHRALATHRGLTDDAAVAEAAGLDVLLVEGATESIKVTTPGDLAHVEALLAGLAPETETRTGSGFDVHRFGPGDHFNMCGVRIAHDHSLLGHSDADVGLHAVTDAILGALSAGDIGQHFPPTDPKWRGMDSAHFLRHACELLTGRRGRVVHVDITLICEAPKLAPYRAAMVERLAALLDVGSDRVSVKATTTEGLGFAGRGEGIAAQATATLSLPRSA